MRSGILLTMAVLTFALQSPAVDQGSPQFDAATIKLDERHPGPFGMRGGPGTGSPGRVIWEKAWLRDLVATAFHVRPENVSAPSWSGGNGAQLYFFTAVMPPDTTMSDFEAMFQTFLVERFRLKLHHEQKAFPTYELAMLPSGVKLKAAADPNAPDMGGRGGDFKIDAEGFPISPPGHGYVIGRNGNGGYGVRFQAYTMAELAEYLTSCVSDDKTRYVVDKTGLTGSYDFTLGFNPSVDNIKVGPQVHAEAGPPQESEPGGLPNVFKAVEQQLGLKLVKAKDILLDTIVIDHAERVPVGN